MMSALILIAGMSFSSVRETGPYDAPPSPSSLIGLIALVLTLVAVFVPGIAGFFLGATGLSAVRESGGKSGGAGFGTFAVLAWPLMILTGIVITAFTVLGGKLFGNGFSPTVGGWLFAATVLVGIVGALWLDFRIVRKTLRWASCQEETKA
jgi:hypothetical protein